jgi:hypothetical protein
MLGMVLAMATSAGAQNVDARWAPFTGCWELIDGGATTCVAAAAPGAVTLSTRVDGKPVLEQTFGDGAPHTLTEPGCTGSQRAEWSRDGRKLFSRAELTCANEPRRAVTGLALMTGNDSWIDVQAVEIAGRTSVRLRKFRRAPGDRPRPVTSIAPYLGAATFTIDDVTEANAKVSPAALEAVLAETGARFALRARDLIALDESGVPGSVIDLMIANSFPQKFQVERRADANVGAYPPAFGAAEWSGYWGLGYPYFYSYPGYYVYDRGYYSPYGYGYPSSYYYYPGRSLDSGGDGEASGASADGDGRVVNGVGYTRVRTREAATRGDSSGGSSSGTSTSRARVTPSGATQSSSGSSSSGGGSSSSGSGSSSSGGGSSNNSGGSDGGRTAQPR